MDYRLREIQRRISQGDVQAVEELDAYLARSGWELIDRTSPWGSSPNELIWLDPIDDYLYAFVIRRADGSLDYKVEEAGKIGEHVGEYSYGEALILAHSYLMSTSPRWAENNTACANPHCASVGRTIVIDTQELPTLETERNLQCVECGYHWTDFAQII